MKRWVCRKRIDWTRRLQVVVFLLGLTFFAPAIGSAAAPGDANDDGKISHADVGIIVEQILGGPNAPGNPDCNGDGVVDIRDVVCVINLVQSQGPSDPAEVATPVDPTVATNLATATEFLYGGSAPIQTGVAPGTIEPRRVAVLRGKVLDRDGNPLPSVTVTILNHPEYGRTRSRTDGMFDMVVNGGGPLTVKYEKNGYLQAQRQVNAPWQDYVFVPDVVLIPVDSQVTTIDLPSIAGIGVAQGTPVIDNAGTRQATLLFREGTGAELVLPDGSRQSVSTLNVRATEFSVGPNGPKAMPAELPPNSAYTYCVELSADEAVSAGAEEVRFTQPVIFYLDNFLMGGVGWTVPLGYYDRAKGVWAASDSGRIIKILSINGGLADLDIDGSGNAAGPSALAALGITDAEREKLATLYPAEKDLWRMSIPHFSPWDANWAFGPPNDATFPKQPPPKKKGDEPDPCEEGGSIVDCHNQTLGESVDIVGTRFRLHYQSNRAPGYKPAYMLDIPLSGPEVPASLIRVELEISIAGRSFTHQVVGGECRPPCFSGNWGLTSEGKWYCRPATVVGSPAISQAIRAAPAPQTDLTNQSYTFTWDGKDAYDRTLQGRQPVTVRIGYSYCGSYQRTDKFGYNGGGMITGSSTGREVTLWQVWRGSIGPWDGRGQGLGGWALSVHHAYDPTDHTLYSGNGEERKAEALRPVMTTFAGNPQNQCPYEGAPCGDGGPARQATFRYPGRVAVGPDGSLYISDGNRIRKVGPDGIITAIVNKYGYQGFSGDGGPAQYAVIRGTIGAVGPDGSLYIADTDNQRIRKVQAGPDGVVTPDSIITTVAGNGGTCIPQIPKAPCGDNGPAVLAQFNIPTGVAVSPDGSLYIADRDNYRIRKVDPSGIITTVAGGDGFFDGGDNGPAVSATVRRPWSIDIGRDGSLYFSTGQSRIRRVGPDGMITTVAGNGTGGFSGDGGPATEAKISSNYPCVTVGPDGSLYIADDYNNRIRFVGTDGIITTFAGAGPAGYNGGYLGEGGPANAGQLYFPRGVVVGPDGGIYVGDMYNFRVLLIKPPLPGLLAREWVVPSDDGSEVHIFSSSGRHLRTVNALTGAIRYQFAYDGSGRLITVADGDGNVTTIHRDTEGNPTAVISPYGQRTALTVNSNGYVASISNPAGETAQLTYTGDGLLTALIDPRGAAYTFTYDTNGLLAKDEDPAGGSQSLVRSDSVGGYEVARTTAENRTTTYGVENLSTGDKRRVNTYPDGTQTVSQSKTDGSTVATYPDGTVATQVPGPDPRFGMLSPLPKSMTIASPGGLTANSTSARAVTLSDPTNPLSLLSLTDTLNMNGRTYTTAYDAATRNVTHTTPTGRRTTTKLDSMGRVIEYQMAGLSPTQFTYDTLGRPTAMTSGSGSELRTASLHYNSQGLPDSITDALSRQFEFEYDLAGRVTGETLPDGRKITYTYDANGNTLSITPPGRPAHSFGYNPVDLLAEYIPPDVLPGTDKTEYGYNKDRQLTHVLRPDGQSVTFGYDGAGRLSGVTLPGGAVSYEYAPATGNLKKITAPDGGMVSYSHDGSLITSETWAGTVEGIVGRAYDNNFRITETIVNSANKVAYQYDNDGLMTQAGSLVLTRSAQNGLLTGTTLGSISDSWSYNSFGEPESYIVTRDGTEFFKQQFTFDKLGRITRKIESIDGATHTYEYTYDAAGRLATAEKKDLPTAIATYTYDTNDNRLTTTRSGITSTHAYDAQDRLVTQSSALGTQSYSYTANGELLEKTMGGQKTTYNYDVLGNLLGVTIPDGTEIAYLVDGQNRRIGKKVNGVLEQGFLYKDQLSPIAELDGSGNVVARFVYGSRYNVPDYMVKGGATYRIVSDHLGSPRIVMDVATGAVVQRIDYDEFGNVVQPINPGFQPFGFAGGIYDPATKLVRFGARDYDAEAGRWTIKDPILFEGGQVNLYAYVGNDPINRIDPYGADRYTDYLDRMSSAQVQADAAKDVAAASKAAAKPQAPEPPPPKPPVKEAPVEPPTVKEVNDFFKDAKLKAARGEPIPPYTMKGKTCSAIGSGLKKSLAVFQVLQLVLDPHFMCRDAPYFPGCPEPHEETKKALREWTPLLRHWHEGS